MNIIKQIFLSLLLLFNICSKTHAETKNDDTMVKLIPGTEEYEKYMNVKDYSETKFAQRSWIMSAIIPTSGQIYNNKYLRAGLYWVGFVGLLGGALYCQNFYSKHLHEKRDYGLINKYAKIRDSFLLGTLVLYIINIADAYVISQLKTFDISDNVNVKVVPKSSAKSVGIGLDLNFK